MLNPVLCDLKDKVDQLHNLLAIPEEGCFTWNVAVADLWEEISESWKPPQEVLFERIRSMIKAIDDHSPWKKNYPITQTMANAVARDECRRLVRLLRAAIGEECNEFSSFLPPY